MSKKNSKTGIISEVSSMSTISNEGESLPIQQDNNAPSKEKDLAESKERKLKPIWDKFLKGIKSKKENQNVVWGTMIKKLHRIKAYQKSTQQGQEAMISDMFNEDEAQEKPAEEQTFAG